MKLKRTKKYPVIIIFVVIIILLGLGVFYFLYQQDHDKKTHDAVVDKGVSKVDYSKPTDDEVKDGQSTKQTVLENDKQAQQDNSTQPIGVTLHAIQNGSQVIFDSLAQIVSNQGTCTLTITSASATVTKTATLFASPSTSSCRGFSVATDELPSGTWKATLTISSDGRIGTVTTSLEVK